MSGYNRGYDGGGQGYDESPSQFAGQGGGFMGTQNETPSPHSPSKGQSGGIIQTLTPVTIRQLFNATQQQPEDIFKVDGKELNQVTIVGQIISSQIQSTNLELVIDDSTGKIDVRQWLEPDEGGNQSLEEQRSRFAEGTYVRVVGHLRAFQQKRNIMAFRIQPIDDWNEITFHLLEAIHVHLFNTRGPLEGSEPVHVKPAATPQRGRAAGGGGGGHGDILRNNVMEVLRSAPESKQGTAISEIVATLPDFGEEEVRQAVDFLINEGHIYTTIDDHVRCAQ